MRADLTATKWCGDCKVFLTVFEFSFKVRERGLLQSYCKPCQSRRSKQHYQLNAAAYKQRIANNSVRLRAECRRRLQEYLLPQRCVDCGLQDLATLEFDHREPSEKTADISYMVQRAFGWPTILHEMDKCDVVCANCHRRRTALQFGWHKLMCKPVVLPQLPVRGSADYERIKSRRSRLARRERNRRLVWNYLCAHPCAACGESDPLVLEFDHIANKAHDLGWLVPMSGSARIEAEIEKCRVLCANCHRRHTAAQNGRLR
jgi:hypothetical protein